tara:strand:+ start:32 stop:1606 length:1575 start_codon:yes stop_codon:yes gene_type:complete
MWSKDQSYQPETKKIVWTVAPYLKGRGIDIGAGMFKVLPQAISVDNCVDNMLFGFNTRPDIKVESADNLSIFASQSMDFVYSSHLLEHMVDPQKTLKEWWRLVKPKGVMVLYLPHEDLYPKCGTPDANIDHKHDLNEAKVIDWMKEIGRWDLEVCEKRDQDEEYSFLMVFRRREHGQFYSHKEPRPDKTACVVRYGAFGDMIQTSTVIAGLKKQGYHVTLFASPPGSDAILHDPNIDKLVLFDKDQVPNADLGPFWEHQKTKFDKWVNLSETVEGSLLAMKGRIQYEWTPEVRHRMMNVNYIEFMHDLAGVPHDPQVKFYTTEEERKWAARQRKSMPEEHIIMWSLAGSSVHKTWAGLDNIIAAILVKFPDAAVLLVGGPECVVLEAGWENEKRVYRTSGKWTIRQTLTMLDYTDLLIGPETGVLNAAACMSLPKMCFLSHSTHENLTRDWKNVIPLASAKTKCPGRGDNAAPACHMLHYGFSHCKRDEASGVSQCMADITIEQVWTALEEAMALVLQKKRKAA